MCEKIRKENVPSYETNYRVDRSLHLEKKLSNNEKTRAPPYCLQALQEVPSGIGLYRVIKLKWKKGLKFIIAVSF